MRVLHVIKVVRIAGAERHLLMLAAGLRARRVDAQIVMLVEPSTPMDDMVAAAEGRAIPLRRIVIRSHADVAIIGRLREVYRELQPDVVHTHLLHADLYGVMAARLSGVPAVVMSRHNDNAFRRRLPIRLANRMLWDMADAGIAISEAIRTFCIEVEGAPPEKVQTVYYGFDSTFTPADYTRMRAAMRGELGVGPDVPLVGMACRLIEQKGVSFGLRAFSRVAARYPNACLVIAGEGPLRASLESEARALSVTDRVHFLGWREDMNQVLAGLDILVMPSLWEGFGLVMLEAMAQRLPVIASAVSAIPEVVINGETGLLVPPRDVTALAGALDTLLGDAPLRQHMGLLGQDRLEDRFSVERMLDKTLILYDDVLRSRGRRP